MIYVIFLFIDTKHLAKHNQKPIMYFVVFLLDIKKNITVPHTWIRNINCHLESFINNGLNCNRNFYTFWTDDDEAFDNNGLPREEYPVNNEASERSIYPNEGWYQCRMKKFRSKFNPLSIIVLKF